jgi:hypothetical protein
VVHQEVEPEREHRQENQGLDETIVSAPGKPRSDDLSRGNGQLGQGDDDQQPVADERHGEEGRPQTPEPAAVSPESHQPAGDKHQSDSTRERGHSERLKYR